MKLIEFYSELDLRRLLWKCIVIDIPNQYLFETKGKVKVRIINFESREDNLSRGIMSFRSL